jgi:hypothetical protein
MDAKKAAEKAKKNWSVTDSWSEFAALIAQEYEKSDDPTEMVYDFVWGAVENHIEWRAEHGRCSGWLEPFAALPKSAHGHSLENDVMDRIVNTLDGKGYGNIKWDRRDERVVLQFKWDQ